MKFWKLRCLCMGKIWLLIHLTSNFRTPTHVMCKVSILFCISVEWSYLEYCYSPFDRMPVRYEVTSAVCSWCTFKYRRRGLKFLAYENNAMIAPRFETPTFLSGVPSPTNCTSINKSNWHRNRKITDWRNVLIIKKTIPSWTICH